MTLERILDKQNILGIQTDAFNHDIQLYVRQRLADEESLQKWKANDTIRQQIESSLMKKACGVCAPTLHKSNAKVTIQVSIGCMSA